MHDYEVSTIGELVGKLVEYGRGQGTFSLSLVLDEAGDYSGMFNFGREAEDSPMVAGSSLGHGPTVIDVLKQMVKECGLA